MKRSAGIIGAVCLALALTSCGGGSNKPADNGASSDPSAAASNASGTITIWGDETRGDLIKALGDEFTKETGINVKFVQKSNDTLTDDYTKQVPAGQGPDIIVTAHDHLGAWVKDGVAGTIDLSAVKDKLLPVAVQAVTYDGQTYGVPYAIENIALVRNNKLTKAEPKTFDEMIKAGKESGAPVPFEVQSDPENGDAYHMYPFQSSFGAPVFKRSDAGYTEESGMNSAEGQAYAKWLAEQGKAGILDVNIGGDKAKQDFLDGKTPFLLTGPWNTAAFTAAGLDFSVMPVPAAGDKPAAPFVGVQGFFPSPKTPNKLLVNKFLLEFVATEKGQKIAYEKGGRAPAWADTSIIGDDAVIKGFSEAGAKGAAMPAIPAMGAVWQFWGSTEANIIQGKQDPVKGWDTMNENIKKAIEKSK